MKFLLPLVLIFLVTPGFAQRDRRLDPRDDYEAMIAHNIRENARAERKEMAIQIARLEAQIQSLNERLNWLWKLIYSSLGGGSAIAGGYQLFSRFRLQSTRPNGNDSTPTESDD